MYDRKMIFLRRIQESLKRRQLDPVSRAVVKDRLTYLPAEKLVRIQRALNDTKETQGDIVEFGIALGGSGIILAHHAGESRRFLGFDVFGMIPPPTSEKDDGKCKTRYETIKSGLSKGIGGDQYYGYKQDLLSDVKASFRRHGVPVDEKKIILYKGLFELTWPTVVMRSISLAHIDCDWYDPVRFCLHACADRLSDGGVIIVDDYNDYGGCRAAVDEFLAEHDDFSFEGGLNPFLRKRSVVGSPRAV